DDTPSVPAISADGRFVAFVSSATNLDPADGDTAPDVFARDLQANTTTLVSRAAGVSGAKGNADSGSPAISADGRFVAFDSFATNLDSADGDTAADVFARDLQAGPTTPLRPPPRPPRAQGAPPPLQPPHPAAAPL